jgi:hypothetical protein
MITENGELVAQHTQVDEGCTTDAAALHGTRMSSDSIYGVQPICTSATGRPITERGQLTCPKSLLSVIQRRVTSDPALTQNQTFLPVNPHGRGPNNWTVRSRTGWDKPTIPTR